MKTHGIDCVLDVGANSGQYAMELRRGGYAGRIISFEPLAEPFAALENQSSDDPNWEAMCFALGNQEGEATINVSGVNQCSSLLDLNENLLGVDPDVKFVGTETIEVRRLDSLYNEIVPKGASVLLKLDVQGFESSVLDGSVASIANVNAIQIEMSLVTLYEGDTLFPDMDQRLRDSGFTLMSVEPTFVDYSGQMLQLDGYYGRAPQR